MKGLVVLEKGSVGKLSCAGSVNSPVERSPSDGSGSCQERVDTKALTGRGSHRELRQLQAEVDRLDQQMRQLASASKQVSGAELYLMLHQRHSTGYQFLRWREMGGGKRHLSWEEGEALFLRYAQPLRSWYAGLVEQARAANEAHLKRRREIKSMRYWIGKSEQQVYARAIPQSKQ